MSSQFQCETHAIGGIAYRLYCNQNAESTGNLLCIHGAGVAGQLTFEYIIYYLSHYARILVPDLNGMGQSDDFQSKPYPSIDDYLNSVEVVLDDMSWQCFDVCGYSLGGLIAAKLKSRSQQTGYIIANTILVEPALFDDKDMQVTRAFRKQYKTIAEDLLAGGDPDTGILAFLDLVSPKRAQNARSERVTIKRLGHRVNGFAQALHAVACEAEVLDRSKLIQEVRPAIIIAGENSYPKMIEFHQQLAQQLDDWELVIVPGCDHSLPYQKPRRIAQVISECHA